MVETKDLQVVQEVKKVQIEGDKDVKQVELLDFPTFEIQRALSKQHFKSKEMEEVQDSEDPANPNKTIFMYQNKDLKIVANKRIQYTGVEDKVLIMLLHNFLKQNNNKKVEDVQHDIALDTVSFIKLTCDDFDTYVLKDEGILEANKLQNERKKITKAISNLTSIKFIKFKDKKMSLFEDGYKRNTMLDQYIVSFTDDSALLLSKKSKYVSINFRPASLFKMHELPYYIGSYFSQILFINKNMRNNRNNFSIKSILEYLDCILPSDNELKKMHGTRANKILLPVKNSFEDLDNANIFDVVQIYKPDKEKYITKGEYKKWFESFVTVYPLDTNDEFIRRTQIEKSKNKEKETKETIVLQLQAIALNEDVKSREAKQMLLSLSKYLGVDYLMLKKAVKNCAKLVTNSEKIVN